jgi:hypothetical protein
MGKLDKDSLADINVDVAHSTYGWLCTNVRNCGTPLLCNEDNGYNFTPVPFTKKIQKFTKRLLVIFIHLIVFSFLLIN